MQVQPKNHAMSQENSRGDEKPIPPRFWWLKRGAIGFGMLFVLFFGLRFWWGHEAQRRMDALARGSHARGEPFYPEDFQQPPVPDVDNAAVPIEAATNPLTADFASTIPDLQYGSAGPPTPAERLALDAQLQRVQSKLRLVRSARSRPREAFPGSYELDAAKYRRMALILFAAENYKHFMGDDRAALEYLHDALFLADVLDQSSLEITHHQMAIGIDFDVTSRLEQIASNLSVSGQSSRGAQAAQVQSMIAALLDERAMQMGAERGTDGEGTGAFYFIPARGMRVNPLVVKALDPMYKMDGGRVYEVESAKARTYGQPTFLAAASKLKIVMIGRPSALEKLSHPVEAAYELQPTADVEYFGCLTDRRAAAIWLAIRLYKADHQGALPGSLSQLVPAYLSAVPSDPFDPANGPIRYLPKHDPPVLYSVGPNGKDDGGSERYLPYPDFVDGRWHDADLVYPRDPLWVSPAQDHQGDEQK